MDGLDEIKKIVRTSLCLEKDVEISDDSTLGELGADRVDFTDILFKTQVYDTNHLSDGNLNDEGREFVRRVAESNPEYGNHLRMLAKEPSKGFINGLTIKEIALMAEYRTLV